LKALPLGSKNLHFKTLRVKNPNSGAIHSQLRAAQSFLSGRIREEATIGKFAYETAIRLDLAMDCSPWNG
jgi:hypothetical protein